MSIQPIFDRPISISSKLGLDFCSIADRIAIADHPRTSYRTLQYLSRDESADLRFALAENHNIDTRILDTLSEDTNPFIAHRARKTLDRLKLRAA